MNLEGKVALVLGGIKGIGRSVGLALAQAGARVALNYYDWEEELDTLKRDVAATGRDHLILKTDLREVADIPLLVQAVVGRFGPWTSWSTTSSAAAGPWSTGLTSANSGISKWKPRCARNAGCSRPLSPT